MIKSIITILRRFKELSTPDGSKLPDNTESGLNRS